MRNTCERIEFADCLGHKHRMSIVIDSRTVESIRSRLDRPVVLIGMMGAGKSRLGRLLAEALNLPFADSDEEIEKAAGCSISDIFERYGEPFFRDRERLVLQRLIEDGPKIIAAGGGAVMQPDTAEAIWNHAVSLWVRAELPVLVERTARNANRPLLRNGDPATILGNLSAKREPVYSRADVVVESHQGPAGPILESALERLDDFLRKEKP